MADKNHIEIEALSTSLYVSPILWKGDPVGHVGKNDVFFYVLDGECYLEIDSSVHIVRRGELAFLPKGKSRRYTQTSKTFSMYEISFKAEIGGENLMRSLGFTEDNFVVDSIDGEELKRLFESTAYVEMQKSPLYDVAASASALNIIRIYGEARAKFNSNERLEFLPVTKFMSEHLGEDITLAELSSVACASPTYFIRKFRSAFGISPINHLNRLRIYKAMSYLSRGDMSIEEIAAAVGIREPSYFARVFKKHTATTPSEYKLAFKRQ